MITLGISVHVPFDQDAGLNLPYILDLPGQL